jgi:hypothetical protein
VIQREYAEDEVFVKMLYRSLIMNMGRGIVAILLIRIINGAAFMDQPKGFIQKYLFFVLFMKCLLMTPILHPGVLQYGICGL